MNDEQTAQDADYAFDALTHPELYEQIIALQKQIKEDGVEQNPPLAFEEVNTFEREHGILLPEAYRLYLVLIGNGGYSLAYQQIKPLETLNVEKNWGSTWNTLDFVSDPFPVADKYIGGEDNPPYEEDQYEEWLDKTYDYCENTKYEILDQVQHGTLYLGGNAEKMTFLVLNGPERGMVWSIEENSYQDHSWSIKAEIQCAFLDWLENGY